MSVKIGNNNNIKEIFELITELEQSKFDFTRFKDEFSKQYNNENYCCLVYEFKNEIVGMINLRFEYQLHHGYKMAEILEFIIADKYRNLGFGTKLYKKACEYALNNDCIEIEVASNVVRKQAHQFYENQDMIKSHFRFNKKLDV